jgi:hypothetical protein
MTSQQREVLMLLLIKHGRGGFSGHDYLKVRDIVEPIKLLTDLFIGVLLLAGYIERIHEDMFTLTDKALQELQHEQTST